MDDPGRSATSDTALDATLDLGAAPDLSPKRIADRYALQQRLGTGGSGSVWVARDHKTGEEVAVKLLDARDRRRIRALRQEVNALRWLRLPGVVGLRDDGLQGDLYFIVMDRVSGRPFPGEPGPLPWEQLRPALIRLAETLARVHLAGVVHRDLKPANVLVEHSGRVVLLDFGLAAGDRLTRQEGLGFTGTPRYAAPEQCRGEICNPAADLYAMGVMAFEALTGVAPHAEASLRNLLQRRAHEPAPPLSSLVPQIPEHAAALVDRLLRVSPEDRPESAEEVLEALGVSTSSLPVVPGVPTFSALRRLFEGPDCFLLRDVDAARLLRQRAGDQPEAIAAELHAWTRADLARPGRSGRLVVERVALAQLSGGLRLDVPSFAKEIEAKLSEAEREVLAWVRLAWPHAHPEMLATLCGQERGAVHAALSRLRSFGLIWPLPRGRLGAAASGAPAPGWTPARRRAAHRQLARLVPRGEARVRHLLAGGGTSREVLAEILKILGAAAAPNQLALLELGLRIARDEEDPVGEAAILRAWTVMALKLDALDAAERALVAVADAPCAEPLVALLQANMAKLRGEPERAIHLVDELGAIADEDLEQERHAVGVAAARLLGIPVLAARLEGMQSWAETGPPTRSARYNNRLSLLRTMQQRFEEVVLLETLSLAVRAPGLDRSMPLDRLASALERLGRIDEAAEVSRRSGRLARRLRNGRGLANAMFTDRTLRYRTGEMLRASPAFVRAAEPFGPLLAGIWALQEGVFAWRAGDRALAAALAVDALRLLQPGNLISVTLIAEALLLAATGPVPLARAEVVADGLLRAPYPLEALQALGLLRRAVIQPPELWRERIRGLASGLPEARWSERMEVMSVAEALA